MGKDKGGSKGSGKGSGSRAISGTSYKGARNVNKASGSKRSGTASKKIKK